MYFFECNKVGKLYKCNGILLKRCKTEHIMNFTCVKNVDFSLKN